MTVSSPGVISVSWIEKAAPSFDMDQRGIASKFGEVQLSLLPDCLLVRSRRSRVDISRFQIRYYVLMLSMSILCDIDGS